MRKLRSPMFSTPVAMTRQEPTFLGSGLHPPFNPGNTMAASEKSELEANSTFRAFFLHWSTASESTDGKQAVYTPNF